MVVTSQCAPRRIWKAADGGDRERGGYRAHDLDVASGARALATASTARRAPASGEGSKRINSTARINPDGPSWNRTGAPCSCRGSALSAGALPRKREAAALCLRHSCEWRRVLGEAQHFTELVPRAHRVTGLDPARRGIRGRHLELRRRVTELTERRRDLGRERGRDQRERELFAPGVGLVDVEAAERIAIERDRHEVNLAGRRERIDELDRMELVRRRGDAVLGELARELGAVRTGGERRVDELLIGHRVALVDEAEPAEEIAEQLVVAARFANRRRDRGRVVHPHVAVAAAELAMLEERRRWKDDVCELRGIGHDLLVDDDEQILAAQLLDQLALIGRGHRRVRVVDEQALDRRLAQRGERVGDAALVARARDGLLRTAR